MKKLINNPRDLVKEELEGFSLAYSQWVSLVDTNLIVRKLPKPASKVRIVMGNGSGHEPAMIGFVGEGMLDVNIPGEIFSAPSPDRILDGIRKCGQGAGVLLLVANHAGDVLSSSLAFEMAAGEGVNIDSVILWDDIASAPREKIEERRGVAGQIFAFKMAGAAAESGLSLSEVKRIAEKARDNTRTLAVALNPGTNPFDGKSMFDLPEDQIEIGMGVHGDIGSGRRSMGSANEIVDEMLDRILDDKPFISGDEVCVLINGMGSTTLMEMFILNRRVFKRLTSKGIDVYKTRIGNHITSQEMAGFSLSLCKVDEELKAFWNAPAECPFFTVK